MHETLERAVNSLPDIVGLHLGVPEWVVSDVEDGRSPSKADALCFEEECGAAIQAFLIRTQADRTPLHPLSPDVPPTLRAKIRLGEVCEEVWWARARACAEKGGVLGADECREAFLCAVWTSAHASLSEDILHSGVPSHTRALPAMASSSLTERYAQSACACSNPAHSEAGLVSKHVYTLSSRCMHAADRSWIFAARKAISSCPAARRVLASSLRISLTAMHAWIDPMSRADWRRRLEMQRKLDANPHFDSAATLCELMPACKAAMRRTAADALYPYEAQRRALVRCGLTSGICSSACHSAELRRHPEVQCTILALASLANCGIQLLKVDAAFATQEDVRGSDFFKAMALVDCIPKREKRVKKAKKSDATRLEATPLLLPVSFATRASKELWQQCFMSTFIPLWAYSCAFESRASRMTPTQLDVLSEQNAATQMTTRLSCKHRLLATSMAMADPAASMRSRAELWKALGVDIVPSTKAKSSDALLEEMESCTADEAGLFLSFSRIANLKEQLLVYLLPPEARAMQEKAVAARSVQDETRPLSHATSSKLQVCCFCHKICSACFEGNGVKEVHDSFRQLGVASCLLRSKDEFYCSRRLSAAYRLATLNSERLESHVGLEGYVEDRSFANEVLDGTADARMVVRMRRDAASVMMQHVQSPPCGSEPLLSVDLIGKAVRLKKNWYTICCYCGVIMRFRQHHRYGSSIACLRCDAAFSGLSVLTDEKPQTTTMPCRFCGKPSTKGRGAAHKAVNSPLDVSGKNALLPAPLRTCYFCPAHYKQWIPQAMKVLSTRVILSHIASGARPVWDTEAEAELLRPKPRKKRKRIA